MAEIAQEVESQRIRGQQKTDEYLCRLSIALIFAVFSTELISMKRPTYLVGKERVCIK
jgi:hypothetical protein